MQIAKEETRADCLNFFKRLGSPFLYEKSRDIASGLQVFL